MLSNYLCILYILLHVWNQGACVYVDKGVPYANGPLEVGEVTVTVTTDASPKHVKVYFPLEPGEFAVIYFIGGLRTYIPAEAYSIFLSKIAAHGFFVFGVDYTFPIKGQRGNVGQDLNQYFKELEFLQGFMKNRTQGTAQWNDTGLLCHSAGCDITLKMIEMKKFSFKASAFLEPFSELIHESSNMSVTVPALMYGAQLSEEGLTKCNIKGYDFEKYYSAWKCPRIALEVADFGHCDILDPVPWEVCHVTHFCKTTNNTRLDQYRQTAQGIVTSFFMTTLQSRPDALTYIADVSKIPLKMLVDKSDWSC